ncbi:DUF378 domain-containing protein [Chlamydia muridarum str. Nigg]|uniref:Membrane protein n=2 Tax=Chlamydia muridarum TaxID=83560 RepID=A0A069ZZI9_CHLMR|nr:DUF378 domain-containing protein [Chlamydia muridarum]UFT32685.1 DUF378 domain-containing protein [Chlamydia trachomatis]AAF39138.1 conserved hypothetical protein [Chlamydia muridarum str. Nigg]AHH22659.1 membrane protein [Chlamydia muridarum str. Nigg3 CMUT3-5]AHH23583.1 membrane protein [Chlamydia muridarum str. Nigg CM972]AID37805.1 membrane protein [Chlamydia muridarum str. Nigg 2 MCR]
MLCKVCRGLSSLIVVLGAINAGILGATGYRVNIVARLLGEGTMLTQAAYVVAGIAGVIAFLNFFKCCFKKRHSDCCSSKGGCHHHTDRE